MSEQHAEREQRVTPLKLFFDLVFVFAFTQVTTVLSDDPTWSELGHGLLTARDPHARARSLDRRGALRLPAYAS